MRARARDLVEDFRREVDDALVPGGNATTPDEDSLWKTSEIIGYLDEAQRECVRHTYVLFGRRDFPVTAGEPFIELPAEFMLHRRARLKTARVVLQQRNVNELDERVFEDYGIQHSGTWEELQPGLPLVAIYDDEPGQLRMVPAPAKDDTLELSFYRWPDPIERGSAELEIDERRFKRALLHWMKNVAYRKQDADALDLQRADQFYREFTLEIDRIYGELRRQYRRAGTVRYGGL